MHQKSHSTSHHNTLNSYLSKSDECLPSVPATSSSPLAASPLDLSTSLSLQFNHGQVAAKSFALTQNPQTLAFDLALVATVDGVDHLFLSLGNANTLDAWNAPLNYTHIPFDAAGISPPNTLNIADVYLMNIPIGGTSVENCFVDIQRAPGDPLQLLDRYYIQPNSTPHWKRHNLAIDLKAGSISSCLGKRPTDYVPGIYTFGRIQDTQELIFAQQSNPFRSTAPPATARLTLPAGASAITSAVTSAGSTNLFVAASGGLYLFASNNQTDLANAKLVVPTAQYKNANLFGGISSLAAFTVGLKTTVFALNAQGELFQVSCLAGSETNPSAWSAPFPLLSGVEAFAFYLNNQSSSNVLFAHTSGNNLTQLSQDAVTSIWSERNILLPTTAVDDMVEFNSFTSHVTVTDDYGNGLSNQATIISATRPVTVYINGVYHLLNPTVPISITTDPAGKINIIQPTTSLDAVYMDVTVSGNPSVKVGIDPTSNAITTLSSIQSGSDLGNVKIQKADGTTQPLVQSPVSSTDKDAAANCLKQLMTVKSVLPVDRSVAGTSGLVAAAAVKTNQNGRLMYAAAVPPSPSKSFGINTVNGHLHYVEGATADKHVHSLPSKKIVQVKTASSLASVADDVEVLAGDFWNWIKNAWDDVTSLIVQELTDEWHFIATIAGEVYDTILDCVAAVVNGIEFVFNKIKVAFEDLIAWLGYLFEWNDILRTHNVLMNVIVQYGNHLVGQVVTWKTEFNNCIDQTKERLNQWANLEDDGTNIGETRKANQNAPGSNSPQSNWGVQHTQNNMDSASTSPPDSSMPPDILTALTNALDAEEDAVKTAANQIKTQVLDSLSSMTVVEALKKLLAICGDFILNTAETIVDLVLDIAALAIMSIFDTLAAPIEIPIISPMYKLITNGSTLSMLDMICLVAAIPVTVAHKTAKDEAPIPDDGTTSALINASSWDALLRVINQTLPQSNTVNRMAKSVNGVGHETQAKKALQNGGSVHSAVAAKKIKTQSLDVSSDVAAKINLAFDIAALPGSVLVTICFFAKQAKKSGTVVSGISFGSYLLFVLPDFEGTYYNSTAGYNIFNEIVTGLAIVKTAVDNVSAFLPAKGQAPFDAFWTDIRSATLEAIINFVWLGPDFWAYAEADKTAISSTLSCIANTTFDAGGMISPLTIKDKDVQWFGPEAGPVVYVAAVASTALCNVGYGFLCVITGVAQADGH